MEVAGHLGGRQRFRVATAKLSLRRRQIAGHLGSNDPADQERAIVYNELVTNVVVLQNVVEQTQALHALKSKGINIRSADLAFLSPYATSKLKLFGDYPTNLKPQTMPTRMTLPL